MHNLIEVEFDHLISHILMLTEKQIVCRAAYLLCIAAEFDWKLITSEMQSNGSLPEQQKFDIEITLTKRRIPMVGQVNTANMKINEEMLKEEAFGPTPYTIGFEDGRFPVTFGPRRTVSVITAWFEKRLILNKSPYPPLDKWLRPETVENYKFWETDDFYGNEIPIEESTS